jgi:hypothetical protein
MYSLLLLVLISIFPVVGAYRACLPDSERHPSPQPIEINGVQVPVYAGGIEFDKYFYDLVFRLSLISSDDPSTVIF